MPLLLKELPPVTLLVTCAADVRDINALNLDAGRAIKDKPVPEKLSALN